MFSDFYQSRLFHLQTIHIYIYIFLLGCTALTPIHSQGPLPCCYPRQQGWVPTLIYGSVFVLNLCSSVFFCSLLIFQKDRSELWLALLTDGGCLKMLTLICLVLLRRWNQYLHHIVEHSTHIKQVKHMKLCRPIEIWVYSSIVTTMYACVLFSVSVCFCRRLPKIGKQPLCCSPITLFTSWFKWWKKAILIISL